MKQAIGGNMQKHIDDHDVQAGSIRLLALGLLAAAAGAGFGVYAELTHGAVKLDESLSVGTAMLGIFLVVFLAHEMRRKWPH
ncbi:hypothetical protein LIG30_3329 [Burkholderia sp. lig30]|jgi:hypothetical protein|uniref:hypothetical protein n=1 Tax=Burkholderia sp. lig30 TaxID=1192124 RepID=UPI00046181F7|nr:hypothetical protein [Burkholderia sp. lig30]KDB07420.1 hypothetical protein LIG30_3329 [Burkholderia sp. lig30]